MSSTPTAKEDSPTLELQETKATIPAFELPLPRFLPRRYKFRGVGSWSGHLAFASDLIVATQPGLIVELGTHWGESYFTFCQAVEDHGLDCLCYAVDHWLGDEHAGRYGEEVFDEVQRYNERHYRQFSYLLRTNFDDAVSQFSDGTIDLLHIDGLHTYEAVSHDFHTWLPKVKGGGIILLHDICPKHQDFGVWRLWDEIKAEFRSTFEFHHSWGLGVVRKEGEARRSPLTEFLFASSPPVREEVRRHYFVYASHLENLLGHLPAVAMAEPSVRSSSEIRVQVFPFGATGYSEETCLVQKMSPGAWNTLTFELRDGIGNGPLRIDPAHEPCFVELGDVLIYSLSSGDLLWSAVPPPDTRSLIASGTAVELRSENEIFFISLGDDPQFILMAPLDMQGALKLTISLRVSPTPKLVPAMVSSLFNALRNERDNIADELSEAIAEQKRTQELLLVTENELHREQSTRIAMQQSLSWIWTEPIRSLMAALRSLSRKSR